MWHETISLWWGESRGVGVGAPFICHLYLAVILLLARFFSSVILQLGNTSQKKTRFLSGIAQITYPPSLELAVLRLQQQDQAFLAHLGANQTTLPLALPNVSAQANNEYNIHVKNHCSVVSRQGPLPFSSFGIIRIDSIYFIVPCCIL